MGLPYENQISTDATPDNSHTLQAAIDGPDVNLYADGVLIGYLDGPRGVLVLTSMSGLARCGVKVTQKGFIKVVRR